MRDSCIIEPHENPTNNKRPFKMTTPRVGIGVLIFKDSFLLLGKRLLNHGTSTWAPPGGHLEFGETFECCAIREVKEETNLNILNPQVIGVTNDIFADDNKHYVSIFLIAKYNGGKIESLEPEKVLSWEWFDKNNLPDNLFLPLKNLLKNQSSLVDKHLS